MSGTTVGREHHARPYGGAGHIANAMLFLATAEAITGQTVVIDCGRHFEPAPLVRPNRSLSHARLGNHFERRHRCLNLADRPDPTPGLQIARAGERVVGQLRDLLTVEDPVARRLPYPTVPNSDGAGEVVAIGPGVTRFSVGDRVMGCFFQGWIDGPITAGDMGRALGGTHDGILAELVSLHENGLVRIPAISLTPRRRRLPCAGVTAWHSLVEVGRVKPGDTVLLLGTGGVSILALQFCRAMGVRTIITSSSEEKLARARAMGAWKTVNYRETLTGKARCLSSQTASGWITRSRSGVPGLWTSRCLQRRSAGRSV